MSKAIGPYSPAFRSGSLLASSGQLGLEPGTDPPALVRGGFAAQATQALANVANLLVEHSMDWGDVMKTTVFLTDMGNFSQFNEIYLDAIDSNRPARSVVEVAGLPMGALVEVEVWAYSP